MSEWGNGNQVTANVDQVSPNGYRLKVTDANQNDVALYAKNSKDPAIGENDPNARALKAEGMAEIVANATNNPASTGLKVTNASTNTGALAVHAQGKSLFLGNATDDPPTTALEVGNTSDNANAYALWSLGQHRMIVDGGMENAITALHVINESAEAGALALKVEGKAEIDSLIIKKVAATVKLDSADNTILIGTDNATDGIRIGHINNGIIINGYDMHIDAPVRTLTIDAFAEDFDLNIGTDADYTQNVNIGRAGQDVNIADDLNVGGKVVVDDLNADAVALQATNTNAGANARALKVTGKAELAGDVMVNGSIEGLGGNDIEFQDDVIFNDTVTCNTSLSVNGDVGLAADLQINGSLTVGPGDAAGEIDATEGAGPTPRNLNIGSNDTTADINLSRAGQDVNVADDLNVGGNLDVNGNVVVGPGNAVGQVDATNDQNLNIGTAGSTADVVIGQGGQDAYVRSDVLKVGSAAGAGSINSGAAPGAPTDLKIGDSANTANLVLLNGANHIDLMSDARLNGKEFVLNNAANLAAANGCGLVFNANGHGAGPSFDFYFNGVMSRYVDATGWF